LLVIPAAFNSRMAGQAGIQRGFALSLVIPAQAGI